MRCDHHPQLARQLQMRSYFSGQVYASRNLGWRSLKFSTAFSLAHPCTVGQPVASLNCFTWSSSPSGLQGAAGPRSNVGALPLLVPRGSKHQQPQASRAGSAPLSVLPNPSLEPTRSGVALGPRYRPSYHRSRGPSATPALAAQLKLQGLPPESQTPIQPLCIAKRWITECVLTVFDLQLQRPVLVARRARDADSETTNGH